MKRLTCIPIALAMATIDSPAAQPAAQSSPPSTFPIPGLVYQPEGEAIVLRNGNRWDNRPLYCHERMAIVYGGEMPALNGRMGTLYGGIERGGKRLPFHHFAERMMRYLPGLSLIHI